MTNEFVYVFCSAEGLWKAEENVRFVNLIFLGSNDPKLF